MTNDPSCLEAFAARLDEAYGGKSAKSIEDASSVPRSSVQKYLTAAVEPKRSTMIQLARGAGVSLAWLATGEGAKTSGQIEEDGFLSFPYIPLDLMTTGQAERHKECQERAHWLRFSRKWADRYIGVAPEDLFTYCQEGDGMEPTLRNYNMLLVKKMEAEEFSREGIYLLRFSDTFSVRRLQRRAGRILIACDNQAYGSFEIDDKDLVDFDKSLSKPDKYGLFGRVVYVGYRL